MADRWKKLSRLDVGDRALLPFQVTAIDTTGATLTLLSREVNGGPPTPTGSLQIAVSGAVSGSFSTDPREQLVFVQRVGLRVGDLLRGLDGIVTAAQAVGLGADGTFWSPYPDGHAPQSQDGFDVVGHIDL